VSLSTKNKYGEITVNDAVIGCMARQIAEETFGVAELAPCKFSDSVLALFSGSAKDKGVKVTSFGNQICLDVFVILIHNVIKEVIVQNLKDSLIYNVERLSGMRVKEVIVHTVGVLAQ
jgi:uncharacterized alkaline shock family protein YloU